MTKIDEELLAWHKKKFPNINYKALDRKLGEEIAELHKAYFSKEGSVFEKFADVYIVLTRLLDYMNVPSQNLDFTVGGMVRSKLENDKKREWLPEDLDGDRTLIK